MVSDILINLKAPKIADVILGTIGEGASLSFSDIVIIQYRKRSSIKIISDPEKAKLPKN